MCYAYKFVRKSDGTYAAFTHTETQRLLREGKIKEDADGYHFARDTIPALIQVQSELKVVPMRWDLIPSGYLKGDKLTIPEVVKRKNSKAKNPATGKSWGFSSFNARLETVRSLPSFREPWIKGQRCVIAVDAFKERPNMDDAPKEFTGREYEVGIQETMFFAGLWDSWTSKDGDVLNSCTVITMSSEGIEPLRKIWHERVPVLLEEESCVEWLDAKTNPDIAFKMCEQVGAENLNVREIIKPVKS